MTKFVILLLALISISLYSCDQDSSSNIDMSDEDLLAILQDVHVANSILIKHKFNERDSVSQILRSQIAEIHDVSVEKIDFVMEQLQLSPAKYLALEKKAVENLKALKDSLKMGVAVQAEK